MVRFCASAKGVFSGPGWSAPCTLGRSGVIADATKREGDGMSPLGTYPLRGVFYRPDRVAPPLTGLPSVPLAAHDGWCDAPDHPLYNRPVSLPFAASHERLWREDHVYDLIVTIGHNDDPVRPGAGSAIFIHLMREDGAPTEGCIALKSADLLRLLAEAIPGSSLTISD